MLLIDPQRGRIWTTTGEGLNQVWESSAYVPGSVMDRMARWRPPAGLRGILTGWLLPVTGIRTSLIRPQCTPSDGLQ